MTCKAGFISNRFGDRETRVLPDSAFSPVRRLKPFFPPLTLILNIKSFLHDINLFWILNSFLICRVGVTISQIKVQDYLLNLWFPTLDSAKLSVNWMMGC